MVDYTANGDSFVPGKPRLWSDKQIFYPSVLNLALHADGKRFAVCAMPEAMVGEKGCDLPGQARSVLRVIKARSSAEEACVGGLSQSVTSHFSSETGRQ
jgi:hypothetical protein